LPGDLQHVALRHVSVTDGTTRADGEGQRRCDAAHEVIVHLANGVARAE